VCPDDVRRVDHRQHSGHSGSRVRPVRGVPVVPQPTRQLGPHLRHPEQVEPSRTKRRREPVPRQRRYDDVERISRIAAMRHRIGQPPDDLLELHG
jgi:hypothetical protein